MHHHLIRASHAWQVATCQKCLSTSHLTFPQELYKIDLVVKIEWYKLKGKMRETASSTTSLFESYKIDLKGLKRTLREIIDSIPPLTKY